MNDTPSHPRLSTPFFPESHNRDTDGPRLPEVRLRGNKFTGFGALLAKLREDTQGKRAAYEQVSKTLKAHGFDVSKSALHRYEKEGRAPDAYVIAALSMIYGVSREGLTAALWAELDARAAGDTLTAEDLETLAKGSDLIRHTRRDTTSASRRESGHDTSRADPRVLQHQVKKLTHDNSVLTGIIEDVLQAVGRFSRRRARRAPRETGSVGDRSASRSESA